MFLPCSLHFRYYYLWIHPISQDVYWSGFVLGGSSCRSGREAVSQYRYGVRICGSCRSGCIYYSGCGGANERASSASPPLFALSPTAEMDSIASLPTGASADGPPSPASIAGSLTGSLVPLVYVEDFYRKHNRSVRALVIMCHGLTHDDGTPAINVSAANW